ncbi:MAG: PqqD family protein [Desulfobacterales bacterium]|nr:PqqD family protein [Desulfobacterales bacterium]
MNKLKFLAINENGFAFSPSTGESFTMNQTGLFIIERMKAGKESTDIAQELTENFEVDSNMSQRDIMDFIDKLRIYKLI